MSGTLYLYAITDRPRRPLPDQRGLEDAPLVRVARGSVAAVATRHDGAELEASDEALWRHEEVVEALMRDRTVLPARFGTVFRSASALRAALAERHDEFARALERVRGRLELGVRVLLAGGGESNAEAAGGAESGQAYLRRRLEERRRASELAESVHQPLERLAVASRARALPDSRVLLSAAYLVEGERVGVFRDEVERLQAEQPTLAIVCTGPWPPYNFTSPDEERR